VSDPNSFLHSSDPKEFFSGFKTLDGGRLKFGCEFEKSAEGKISDRHFWRAAKN
jgi:hypothetical protein